MTDPSPRWRHELQRLKASPASADRPFVSVCFAISQDFCLSSTRGAPSPVSNSASLSITHELRTAHDALLVGVGTVLSDDPVLTSRLAPGPSPRRVVLDSRLRVPSDARLLRSSPSPALLMTTAHATPGRVAELRAAGAEVVHLPAGTGGVKLLPALQELRARGVRSLMVEGGVAVLESFFEAGLIDFLAVTVSSQQLDNPLAVRLGPMARATLAAWKVPPETVGTDTWLSGPFDAESLKAAS